MSDVNPKLVADLARLATKYPSEDWDGLLDFLRDPARAADIVAVVDQLASLSKRSRSIANVAGGSKALRESLRELEASDPARAAIVNETWARLRRRELLPSLADVKSFADLIGLKGLTVARREQAVTQVVKQMIELPTSDLASAVDLAADSGRSLGTEYGRWVHLILDRPTEGSTFAQPDVDEGEGDPSSIDTPPAATRHE